MFALRESFSLKRVLILACSLAALFAIGIWWRGSSPRGVQLGIENRNWAPGAPKRGWCAEASIQMAGLYFGAYFPQSTLNFLGRLDGHPDVWGEDIPTVLDAASFEYDTWVPRKADVFDEFIDWITRHLSQHQPVVLGTKIYPSEHPKWDFDHFVLAAGFRKDALTLNTNIKEDGQMSIPLARLSTTKPGYSLAVPYRQFIAFALKGIRHPVPSLPVRLTVESETTRLLRVRVLVSSLEKGKAYILRRSDLKRTVTSHPFFAKDATQSFSVDIDAHDTAIFTCVPAESENR